MWQKRARRLPRNRAAIDQRPYGIFAGNKCYYWTIKVTVVVCVAVVTPLALPLAVIVI